ncbi:MAG: asparagine synthase-related protein, partial [Chthoniobacterales bacterium]
MLSAMHQETFYVAKQWSCPTGRATFATLGLEGLQGALPVGAKALKGLAYGRPRFPTDVGRGWLANVAGSFSLAVHDRNQDCYLLATDRKSSEPVFYTEVSGVLCFAPEVGVLASLPGVRKKADYAAVASLMASGHLVQDRTLFRDIRRLEGGSALQVGYEGLHQITYWRFSPGVCPGTSEEELLERLDSILGRSVEADVKARASNTAIFLSGGYDSRAILGYARDFSPLRTVSWGVEENEPDTDAEIAGRLARRCRTHHVFMRRECNNFGEMFEEASNITESQSDVAAFHPQEFRLMRQLRLQGFTCVVRGDETFGWKKTAFSMHGALAAIGLRYFGSVEGLSGIFVRNA